LTGSGSRLTIIGGGVMGLMTAYHAAPLAGSVTVLDKSRVGDPGTASFGLTRSVRNDYLDPQYARLAFEARQLWLDLQERAGQRLLVDCGCLNLAKSSVTPDVPASYAARSFAVLEELGLRCAALPGPALAARFPQFAADGGWLDVDAGFADVAAVTALLRSAVPARGVAIREETQIRAITRSGGSWQVQTSAGPVESDVLVITAGLGTNELLELIPGCSARFPLSPDRPVQSKYFIPAPSVRDQYTEETLPVFAYLDVGIYGHPVYAGKTPGVKIGFYHPPDAAVVPSPIKSVEDFVAECMPGLAGAATIDVAEASGVDTCFYDLVGDDDFILGPLPGGDGAFDSVFVGVGWRGTGYKFAPWVGRVLAQLAVTRGTVYDISRFAPGRFASRAQATEVQATEVQATEVQAARAQAGGTAA
jgi:sarcosine oxidase